MSSLLSRFRQCLTGAAPESADPTLAATNALATSHPGGAGAARGSPRTNNPALRDLPPSPPQRRANRDAITSRSQLARSASAPAMSVARQRSTQLAELSSHELVVEVSSSLIENPVLQENFMTRLDTLRQLRNLEKKVEQIATLAQEALDVAKKLESQR